MQPAKFSEREHVEPRHFRLDLVRQILLRNAGEAGQPIGRANLRFHSRAEVIQAIKFVLSLFSK